MNKLILLALLIVGCDEYAPTDHTHTDTGVTITDTLFVYDTLIVTNYDTSIVLDTLIIEQMDCAGVQGGMAQLDNCGVCDTDLSNDCVPDCAGVWGGDAVEDCAGICGGTAVSDIDGNCYSTVQIGDQLWIAENLKATKYRDGSYISSGHTDEEWIEIETGAYAVYGDDPSNAEIYGNLYNWAVVNDDRDVCPEGFHVPSDEEYTILTDYLGGESVAGGKMKETGLEHWNNPNPGATNESGFTGLPAGFRNFNSGYYTFMGDLGYFWSSSESNSNTVWYRELRYNSAAVSSSTSSKQSGFSIRCLAN